MIELESDEITYGDNKKYCLGFCFLNCNKILLESKLSIHDFFKYPCNDLLNFFIYNAYVEPNWNRFEILQFDFMMDKKHNWFYYSCIMKTFYIRIIQRVWKKVYRKRKQLLNNSFVLYKFITHRQRSGRVDLFTRGYRLQGMLHHYK